MSTSRGGSCALFAVDEKKGWVITNRHVVGSSNQAWVTFPADESTYIGRVTWLVPGVDAAVILIAAPRGINPLPLADLSEMPSDGDEIYLAGWGGPGAPQLTLWRGISRGVADEGSRNIVAESTLISGDSGGPQVFRGKICGVSWGWTGRTKRAEAVSAAYIVEELRKRSGRAVAPLRT